MFAVLAARLRATVAQTAAGVHTAAREALRPASVATGSAADLFRSRDEIDVNAKEVIHVGVTRAPTEAWTAQQLRQLTPFGKGPPFIIRDRDDKFGADFDRVATGAGIRVLKTAVQALLMNATCECFIGSVRRECLEHGIVLGEAHLQCVLEEHCFRYFNRSRAHQGLEQRVPVPGVRSSCSEGGKVVALPVLGGLHHEYRWAA